MSTHDEIQSLLGAYALDAVEPDEAARIEAHLAECPRCRAEVAEHRGVAALLTSGVSDDLPPGLWDRIAADLGDEPAAVPLDLTMARSRRAEPERRRPPVLAGLAAAAAVILVAAVGAVLVGQRNELEDLRAEVAAGRSDDVSELLTDPDTQLVDLEGGGQGDGVVRAVVGGDGDAVLLAAGLPPLGEDRTYQLWGLVEGAEAVSLGVLGPDPERSDFRVEGPGTTLAITEEPAGGSARPTDDPLVTGAIT